jgi:hypothetical protein
MPGQHDDGIPSVRAQSLVHGQLVHGVAGAYERQAAAAHT